ncbi:MAG TPA: hypothetical protein VH701_00070 [Vicinamibacterales bacterium]
MTAHSVASWLKPLRLRGWRKPRRKLAEWSIGIYGGPNPLALAGLEGVANPVLTCRDVSDIRAELVADPFMIQVDGTWFMLFEVHGGALRKGAIGLATSSNGLTWKYEQIVLAEPWHLSYPCVFRDGSDLFMMPESCEARSVPLYRATHFPYRWERVSTVLDGVDFADATPFFYEGHWWLFASTGEPRRRADDLHLFYASELAGPWHEHPMSPVVRGDAARSRPGGRVVMYQGRLHRFAQDCHESYGRHVRAFEMTTLTPYAYAEREAITTPVIAASGTGWNATGMHHVDPHQRPDGSWFACVDGRRKRERPADQADR